MRCWPIALRWRRSPERMIAQARLSALVTHHDPRCEWSTVAAVAAAALAVQGRPLDPTELAEALDEAGAPPAVGEAARRSSGTPLEALELDDPGSMGYTLKAMQVALWCMQQPPDFEAAVTDLVNAGGDTDTNGAVAGAVMGARVGESSIPQRWVERVLDPDGLRWTADALLSRSEKGPEDLRRIGQRLRDLCSEPRIQLPAGVVRTPKEPIDIRTLLLEELRLPGEDVETVEERLEAESELALIHRHFGGPQPDVLLHLSDLRIRSAPIQLLASLSFGGSTSFAYVGMDHLGNPPVICAALDPGDDSSLWDALLVDLMRDNGRHYGVTLLERPPDVIAQSGLLSEGAIRDGFYVWAEGAGGSGWLDLAEWIIERAPDAERRTMLEALMESGEAALSDEEKRSILRLYVEQAYQSRS